MGKLHERNANLIFRQDWATNKERIKEKQAGIQKAKDKIYSKGDMPDEEFLRRNARTLAAKRRGSRASTVLTEDKLG